MAEILLWCLVGVFVGVVLCALVSACIVCSIADDCDQHARHIEEGGGDG